MEHNTPYWTVRGEGAVVWCDDFNYIKVLIVIEN